MTDKQLADQIRASAAKLCADLNVAGEAGLTVRITLQPGFVMTGPDGDTIRKMWCADTSVNRVAHF